MQVSPNFGIHYKLIENFVEFNVRNVVFIHIILGKRSENHKGGSVEKFYSTENLLCSMLSNNKLHIRPLPLVVCMPKSLVPLLSRRLG